MSTFTFILIAFGALTFSVLLLVGLLIVAAEPRASARKRAAEGELHRYECTCGWHGWRTHVVAIASFKCPRCNGVAVLRSYRESVQ